MASKYQGRLLVMGQPSICAPFKSHKDWDSHMSIWSHQVKSSGHMTIQKGRF